MYAKRLKNFIYLTLLFLPILQASSLTVVAIAEVFTHNEKGNYGGIPADMISGTGMNSNPFEQYAPPTSWSWPTSEPSTWTVTSNAYADEWQSGALLNSGSSINSKVGWAIFDLGASYDLDTFYIWNERENSNRYTKTFNVYIAETPSVAPSHGPTSGALDYDFSSGGTGWTKVNTSGILTGTHRGNQTVDLDGYTGRYVSVEILSNNGDANRVGLAEVAVTIVLPPPKGTLLRIE